MKNIRRFFSPPKGSYFLFGPRGVGKSTWLKNHYPNSLYIDLLLASNLRAYSQDPDKLKAILSANHEVNTVIIDEIQRVPDLLPVVHSLIEEKEHIQFILTGSSSRKLKRAGVDLLAGRAIMRYMHPFMAAELDTAYDFSSSLEQGMVPLVLNSKDPEEVLQTYVNLYIQEEVQAESLSRQLGNFFRFLSVIALSHTCQLNLTNIARECEVKRHQVESYLAILEDLLLCYQIPVFTFRAKRALQAHPKFYLYDVGIFRALRATSFGDSEQELEGAALEGLVFQHIIAWNDYSKEKFQLSYWRTKAGLEVDFIVHNSKHLWAIEVKNGTKISPKDLRGLLHFKEDYPESIPLFLYRGVEKLVLNGILCIPCEDFLKELIPNQPLYQT